MISAGQSPCKLFCLQPKLKMSLCLIMYHADESYGEWTYRLCFPNHDAMHKFMFTFTPQTTYSGGKRSRHMLNMRTDGPHSQSGSLDNRKASQPCRKSSPDYSVPQLKARSAYCRVNRILMRRCLHIL